jgi:hypothetical protein
MHGRQTSIGSASTRSRETRVRRRSAIRTVFCRVPRMRRDVSGARYCFVFCRWTYVSLRKHASPSSPFPRISDYPSNATPPHPISPTRGFFCAAAIFFIPYSGFPHPAIVPLSPPLTTTNSESGYSGGAEGTSAAAGSKRPGYIASPAARPDARRRPADHKLRISRLGITSSIFFSWSAINIHASCCFVVHLTRCSV